MSSKQSGNQHRKLMDQLAPEAGLGRVLGFLGTSYEFQPEFFETDLLPTLFGLGAWDDQNWTSRIALEKQLAELESATLLVDARPYRGRPRSLRVEVEPVFFPQGRILHAKVLLVVYEEAIKLLLGSANLTEPGYRRNREVAAVLTASAKRQTESHLISDTIDELLQLLPESLTPSSRKLIKLAKRQLAEWARERSSDSLVAWSGGAAPLWKQLIDVWPEKDLIKKITVVSPFWSEEDYDGPIHQFIGRLQLNQILDANAELHLLTEAEPADESGFLPKLPESFASFDASQLGIVAQAWPVDPVVPPEQLDVGEDIRRIRRLHAKVLLFEGDETSLAYFGSANFTKRGWGFLGGSIHSNVEAGLIVKRTGSSREMLKTLLPKTSGSPTPLSGAASGRLAGPEPSPDEPPWPSFLQRATLIPLPEDRSRLGLKLEFQLQRIEGSWSISRVGEISGDTPNEMLTGSLEDDRSQSMETVELTDRQVEQLLKDQEVLVRWWRFPSGRNFPINVDDLARTELPLVPGSGRPDEQHLISYYQGKIAWEELFPEMDASAGNEDATKQSDDGAGVDTSRIQSYMVREFVDALSGVRDDVRTAAQSSPACMRLALLGPVSPVALAKRIVELANEGKRTPTACGFQLVELLASLDVAKECECVPRFKEDWHKFVEEAIRTIEASLDSIQDRYAKEMPREFNKFKQAVRTTYRERQGSQ